MALIDTPSNKVLDDQIRTAISVVAQQLNTKARLGAVAQSFDADAVDGDGDGMVQDGSPFERPAVISAVSKASQRIGQLLAKAGRSKQSRAKEYQRRYSGMSAQDIARDAVPDSFEGWVALTYEKLRVTNPELPPLSPDMTPDEVKRTVRALEDFVESDLVWIMTPEKAEKFKELKKTDRAAAFRLAVDGAFDFSPEAVAKNRELLEHVLTTNPQYRAMVEKFGHPAVFRIGPDIDKAHMAQGMYSDSSGMGMSKIGNVRRKGRLQITNSPIGKWFMSGIMTPEVGHRKTKRWVSDNTPEALLIHEYGHYLTDALKPTLSDIDNSERTKRWQAFRFGSGSDWKETFTDIGHPEFYDKYAIERLKETDKVEITRIRKDIPDELPHVRTAYGESAPAEAWAEAIAATFSHEGRNSDLVSPGMRELINAALELPEGGDPRESLTPTRQRREIVPDGFASRGSVMAINSERDSRYGEITDPYELTAEVLGDLGKDDPVGQMVRKLQDLKDDPERWDRLDPKEKASILRSLNIRQANEEEAILMADVFINNPAFADMVRRHGMSNIYFAQEDMRYPIGDESIDIRGSLFAGFTPDESDAGRYWPARIVIDMLGPSSLLEDGTLDVPIQPVGDDEVRKARKAMNIPGGVTRTHLSKSHAHVIRHEGGHAIHDMLWERVHRGEIKGRRAQLIRAYGKTTWEEFYTELGRPDLLLEYQRSIKVANSMGYPGDPRPSGEIAFVDSGYAWSNPREFFAESFGAYTSSNPAFRELLNDTALEHMQTILGDADSGSLEGPPSMGVDTPGDTNVPEPPPWDGFASVGGDKPKSYGDVRRNNIKEGKGKFSRSSAFRNTTTEQKVDLTVPTNEQDYMLMAWDHIFERLGIEYDVAKKIDLTDPANPKVPRRWKGALDGLDFYVAQMQRDMPDFSPEKVKANREALRASLDAFPRMREAAERFGMPPLTSMTESTKERLAIEYFLAESNDMFRSGKNLNIRSEFLDVLPLYRQYAAGELTWQQMLDNPTAAGFSKYIKQLQDDGTLDKYARGINGGFSRMSETILMPGDASNAFVEGKRYDPTFVPEPGDWGITGNSYEEVLLHEFSHYIDARLSARAKASDPAAIQDQLLKAELFDQATTNIKTKYGQTNMSEFAAEAISAIMSGNRDAEELLSPETRQWARRVAGFPEKDPVFAGRTRIPGQPITEAMVVADRFGQMWRRTTEGMMEAFDAERGKRSRDGVPDVLETFGDAVRRTGLTSLSDVEFEHEGRKFTMRDNGTVFEIDINGRTVATASVVEGQSGLPEINTVDVLPGYEGIAPDQDLHEMVVDHARTKFPSARAPKRARKTEVSTEGFASVGPQHHDARGIDGTPGTPEYAQSVASEFESARANGKKVFFDYNGETREVEVTEIFEKNGILYMKGNDALRNGEERMFRLDRVSMPKRVQNPETGADEIAKKPGKPPRKPVPVFTGKAAEIFEGAQSWEEVAQRLSKGRYVFFDFETTGIEEGEFGEMAHPGSPTQIGLVEIIDGKVTRRWSTHVNPGRQLSVDPKTGRSWSADNLKYKDPVTGELVNISDEWLATQKPLKDALEEMLEFIGPDTILGGQNHPYDDDVMRRALIDAGIDESRWNPAGFIDSQALAQALLDRNSDDYPVNEKGSKTVSLGYLAKFLGHDMGDGWHSADADSEASWEAFSRLVKRAADHENSGKPVRRDLFAPGGAIKEHGERLNDYERQKSGWDYKVKKYRESKESALPGQSEEGFASRGVARVREVINKRRRAKDPASWENLTPEQRDAATQASAKAAIDYLNTLQDVGIDVAVLRDLDRAELDAILKDLVPGGEARVSEYVTGDGKALIEVSNATMGKVFMSLGFHVQVVSDDPNEQHLLENGINDMQKALQDYVSAVAKDPDALLKDRIFMDWADKEGLTLGSLSNKKQLEGAAKKFAEQFEINLCLYYKSGTNMLCGANIGIQREEMPQIGGRMKGDDTLAARAIKSGLMAAKEFKIDNDKLSKLDQAKQDELKKLAKDPARVAELAKSKDPLAQELFDVLNWNDTEASVEAIADRAAEALGITVEKPRLVDPATMLGAQNELQGSKVENMADGVVKAVTEALPVLEARLGRTPTQAELMDYLVNETKHGLFQPIITAGLPGGQTYVLDGHHRWAGLLMGNKKLEAMGIDLRVQLNIKNYQTDIRSGLELGRAMQVAVGIKDAKLAGEAKFVFDPNIPELTEADFDKAIADLVDPAKLVERIREVREGGKFRETEAADIPGGQVERLAPRKRPIREIVDEITGNNITLEPQSRVKGVKPAQTGYRAAGSGSGWQSVEDYVKVEMDRGNELFETHKEYLDKGYETAWVTHTPGEAGRYVVSAGDVAAWESGEIKVNPEDIAEVDMAGATLVGTDGEGGFLYARRKQSKAIKERLETLKIEEDFLDQMASIPQQAEDAFGATKQRDKINRRGLVDRLLLTRSPVGEEARNVELDAGSINKPKPMDKDKFFGIVGELPGVSDSDELLATEKITSSRVKNLTMYRATYQGANGKKKNRILATYKAPNGKQYTIGQDPYGYEGIYYVLSGKKKINLEEYDDLLSERVGKLKLLLNDGEKNVHDLFSIAIDEDERGAGIAQALVEVAKADFPEAKFTVQRVVTEEGAGFARNLVPQPEETAFASEGPFGIGTSAPRTPEVDFAPGTSQPLAPDIEFAPGTSQPLNEPDWLDEPEDYFASTGTVDRPIMLPLDLVSGVGDTTKRGGKAQRDREVVPDDFYTRQPTNIAGVRVPEFQRDEAGAPMPGAPIYRESVKIGLKNYTFEVDADGIVSVYTGRKYKMVAQMNLDRGHSHIGGRKENRSRHHIDFVHVDKKHRRKGIATTMSEMAEHAYGGQVEHSAALTKLGRKFRDADMSRRGTPGADPVPTIEVEGFASRGNFQPIPTQDEDLMGDSVLDQLADKLDLDELPEQQPEFDEIEQMAARIAARVAGGEATLAERLGVTPEQLRGRIKELAKEINEFVDRFVQDKEVRKNVKLGYKILSNAALLFGMKGMKDFLSTINPSAAGTGQGSDASSLLDIVDVVLSTGLHDALIAYGMNFAQLIATEYASMRLVSKQKAKEMIEDIRARIEGTGQKIGVMSTEMWNRLRGAWAKTRSTAPIPAIAGVKEWIVAGSSPMWAEMSWGDYQAKGRITQHLEPTNQAIWSALAVKVGRSPELIDIAVYRSGLGYGTRRIKSKDVVRVYVDSPN